MTQDEYIDFVVQVVRQNLRPNTSMITAAALGELLRRAAPDHSWREYGNRSLADFLRRPELERHLRLTQSEKGALAVELIGPGNISESPRIQGYNPLRKPIWIAFVQSSPHGRRFINRRTGAVRLGLQESPSPADAWAEISPIASETQRDWAEKFLAEFGQADSTVLQAAVKASLWRAHGFYQALQAEDDSLARSWNKFRSAKVSEHVEGWLRSQALPLEFAFQTGDHPSGSRVDQPPRPSDEGCTADDGRRVILAALALLPLESLAAIPIPAGIMLRAIQESAKRS